MIQATLAHLKPWADFVRERLLQPLDMTRTAATFAEATARVDVRAEAGELRLAAGSELTGRLEHWHYDTFRVAWDLFWLDPTFVRFEIDAQGRASRLWLGGLADDEAALQRYAREECGR